MPHPIFGTRLGVLAYRCVTENRFWEADLLDLKEELDLLPEGARVLDIGCGPGRGTLKLAESLRHDVEVVGLDVSLPMIETARHQRSHHPEVRDRVRFVSGDARDLPFDDEAFDAVIGHSVLYLIDDPARVLAEVSRVVRPGGTILFMEPSAEGSLIRAAADGLRQLPAALRSPLAAFVFLHAIVQWRILARVTLSCISRDQARRWSEQAGLPPVATEATFGSLGWRLTWRVPQAEPTASAQPALALVASER